MSNGLARFESRSGYSRYGYRTYYHDQSETIRKRVWAANMERWLARSKRNSIADRASMVTNVRGAFGKSFRLVDGHGRAYGPRYTCQMTTRSNLRRDERLVEDGRGREIWLMADARCRIVARQAEDLHSQLSRMLKAAHRRGE